MKIVSNGKTLEVTGPRGPAGPDGNPIGSIISYMGTTAPKDYLICDGAVYNISDYSALSNFFKAQFGSANYFGGDGATTFAVPDLRNLFLRGYHGEAEERLSGDVGVKQEGTKHLNNGVGGSANSHYTYGPNLTRLPPFFAENQDSAIDIAQPFYTAVSGLSDYSQANFYTSRPVNMAVLYCIKAVESVPAENIYSTEEQVVGRWIDGKPIYQKTIQFTVSRTTSDMPFLTLSEIEADTIVDVKGYIQNKSVSDSTAIGTSPICNAGNIFVTAGILHLYMGTNVGIGSAHITIQYTKTTDQATIELPAMAAAVSARIADLSEAEREETEV